MGCYHVVTSCILCHQFCATLCGFFNPQITPMTLKNPYPYLLKTQTPGEGRGFCQVTGSPGIPQGYLLQSLSTVYCLHYIPVAHPQLSLKTNANFLLLQNSKPAITSYNMPVAPAGNFQIWPAY